MVNGSGDVVEKKVIFSYLYIITQRRQLRMESTYHWEGDYLIPDVSLDDGSSYNIGKYGRMRQKYLCEKYPSEYLHLVITEKLWKQLEELEEECHEMLDRLMEQMAKREGLTEHMKSIFEEMGGTYRREGDYLIPNL